MTCDAFENRILDYHENQLSADEREMVERHLAGCASCQAFARQFGHLNAALSSQLRAPALPANFDSRLWQRIQTETVVLSETERAERKRQMQLEYESGQARLRRHPIVFARLLDVFGYAAAAAVASWVIWQFTPALTNFLGASGSGRPGESVVLVLASGAFVFIVLTATMARPFRKVWSVL